MSAQPHIVVLGGGFAGLESAFLLRSKLDAESARITLVSDDDRFLFKPNTIYIPFGRSVDSLRFAVAPAAARRSIEFVRGRVVGVDPSRRVAQLEARELPYDFAVLATGATMRPEEIDDLGSYAETIWTPEEMLSLRAKLTRLVADARSGRQRTVLFAVPPNNKCAGPLYEIVFMLETWLRREHVRDRVRIVYTTYEDTYIQAFGSKLHDVVTQEFDARGIEGRTGVRLTGVSAFEARYEDGRAEPYDLLIAFPPYVAAVRYDLPADDRGFLSTDPSTRRVRGQERIFAPGDAGDFPVKQAFLAFLQADAVAETIAAELEAREPEFGFDPVSMCVMEEFDTATFAQVPLRITGDPQRPIEVRPDANGSYRVGVSPAWRLGKKMLGVYLPLRFRAGLPFHAGLPWQAMELGLKGMSKVLARR